MDPAPLRRPPAKAIKAFHIGQVGDDTIRTFLENSFSLAICCKACPRLIEWTPPELAQKFGDRPDLRLADLVPRLACTGEGGCGSHEIAVFPHFWAGPWRWTPPPAAPKAP